MLHRIRIQNFKSIRDVTVDLDPVTVLVGRSGVGKTNFVLALRFLRDYLQDVHSPYQSPTVAMGQTSHVLYTNLPLQFHVDFSVPGFDHDFSYELILHNHSALNPLHEALVYGKATVFDQTNELGKQAKWQTEPAVFPTPPPGPPALGRIPGLQESVMAYAALTLGIGVHRFPASVLEQSEDANGSIGLSDDASNYFVVLRELVRNWQSVNARKDILAALQKINPTVKSVELDSLQQPTEAIVGHDASSKAMTLNLAQESDGFRRFYAHLLALYQTPPKQSLIFEEPENGIHPGALSLLAEEFQASPVSGRSQVILTTQSPGLLDHFRTEQIRVVELIDLETKIGTLAEEQREAIHEQLLHPGELLTVDPARREESAV